MPTVNSAGVPIHYEVAGEGSPIVLVPGYMATLESLWQKTGWVDFLVELGRTVVGLDCRGHGKSGKPRDPDAYQNPKMPDDVLAVMDTLGLDRVDLMGYSMGGAIALNLLAHHPDRFSSVIVGGAGVRLDPRDPKRTEAIAAALEAHDTSTISDPVARFMRSFADSRANDPDSLADADPDLYAFAAITRRGGTQTPEDVIAAVKLTQVPLLAVVGENDIVLSEAQRLAETAPNAQLVIVPGTDHLATVTAVAYKDAVAKFLGWATLTGR